jgi:hypothetical protein
MIATISTLVLAVVLAVAPYAAAESAWVLWTRTSSPCPGGLPAVATGRCHSPIDMRRSGRDGTPRLWAMR